MDDKSKNRTLNIKCPEDNMENMWLWNWWWAFI